MNAYTLVSSRDLVPGARFVLGCLIVEVASVTHGLDKVAVRSTKGAVYTIPANDIVDATLPDCTEVWCRRCETIRGIDSECRCGASAIGPLPMERA